MKLAALVFATVLAQWASSPEAFFMTKAERAEWSAIKTDAAAETFVQQFIARRDPGFEEEVAKRVAVANKFLTTGKTPGSRTVRGQIIILLGAPSSFNITNHSSQRVADQTSSGYVGASGDFGASLGQMRDAQMHAQLSGRIIWNYDIGYAADQMPAAYGKPFNVTVQLDAGTGKERVSNEKELQAVLEMAAAASIKK